MIRNPKIVRSIAVYLLIQFTSSIIVPSVSYALTSGPSQPEFSSFEPVATTNMVNEFSGDFTYNLPLLEVPGPGGSGYPVSLSYHSGASPEEEASWVGYGWTLNPGAINRGLRGVPDDHKGQTVTFHNKMPKNWTGTVAGSAAMEVFGKDMGAKLSANAALRYNNYRGFGYNAGLGLSLGKGLVSMGYNVSDGEGSFSTNVNPYAILTWASVNHGPAVGNLKRYTEKGYSRGLNQQIGKGAGLTGSSYGIFSYTEAARPNVVTAYSGKSYNVTIGFQINPVIIPTGIQASIMGSYTFQENTAKQEVPTYGFLYSAEGAANTSALMDYHVEREKDFNKRDVFIGVPFNDADNFVVSGEGINGGFRLHNKTVGHFGPRHVSNEMDIYNVGGEMAGGWTFGPGVDVGKGTSKLRVNDWNRSLSSFQSISSTNVDEPVFFRFSNDMGGEWGSNFDDAPFRFPLSDHEVTLPVNKDKYTLEGDRVGRSSYIGYHLNGDMQQSNGTVTPVAYCRDKRINSFLDRTSAAYKDMIGEIAVFNEDGGRYVYGLPVYAAFERSLSYGTKGTQIVNNYAAYTNSPDNSIKVGEEKLSPYATTYLLTEITTPDYVDRGEIDGGYWGPTPDDLGGYTYFGYRKFTGDPGDRANLYTWRLPFEGMTYARNSLSDPLDDMVTYSEGSKELYYLDYIETKTHVAFFSTSAREDGREAKRDTYTENAGPGTRTLEKLDTINLYRISDCTRDDATGKLIAPASRSKKALKTVVFEYDYTLTNHVPNSTSGKLTLKRLYFQYNGIKQTAITPYDFVYQYPTATEYDKYPERYRTAPNDITSGYRSMTATSQNPDYSVFMMDAWGNYQLNGQTRYNDLRPWLDQLPVAGFDPAAWQLKVIKLPSGGEIHVQYEQDDYNFVQDQEAHVMATLTAGLNEDDQEHGHFYIDPASVGIDPSSTTQLDQVCAMITERYVTQKKKIYFKILYSLIGDVEPNLHDCNVDYISGYASVLGAFHDSNGIGIQLAPGHRLPYQVCKDFVKSQRLGKVVRYADCDPAVGTDDPNDPQALVNQLLSLAENMQIPNLCKKVDEAHSYFRIPTPFPKKGGGIRVKRLLMFDQGLENNPVLYGQEYFYKTMEGGRVISSGVATNEPSSMREENILVDFVARKNQNYWSEIIAGRDRDQSEAPIGETVLPGPSVGYSRVIARNIYTGTSNPGFSSSEFYTARDYPALMAHPDKSGTMTDIRRIPSNAIPLTLPLYTKLRTKTSAVQGFSYVLNNMHGQPRASRTYEGSYSVDKDVLANARMVTEITSEYYKPGEDIPMMSSRYGGIQMRNPGREVDMTFAQRQVVETTNDVNVEGDLQVTIIPLAFVVLVIPYPTGIPFFSDIRGEMNTHATTKVVRYPAILKRRTILQDGIEHVEENVAFNEFTGQPVAVKTSDDFKNGGYLTQTIPASWEYPDMGGKWKTEGKRITGNFTFNNDYITLDGDPCNMAFFTRGDQIRLGDSSSNMIYHVLDRDYLNNRLKLEIAIGASVASGTMSELTILHAGKTNQLRAEVGSITSHNERAENLKLKPVDQTNRYDDETSKVANNPGIKSFAQDLKARAQNLSGKGKFTLAGPYTEMDMSAFASLVGSCTADLTNARVTNLTFRYTVGTDNQATLQLMEFWLDCAGTNTQVKAEGWQ